MPLASVRCESQLHAVSSHEAFQKNYIVLRYVPEFHAETATTSNPLPQHFFVKALTNFVGSDN